MIKKIFRYKNTAKGFLWIWHRYFFDKLCISIEFGFLKIDWNAVFEAFISILKSEQYANSVGNSFDIWTNKYTIESYNWTRSKING